MDGLLGERAISRLFSSATPFWHLAPVNVSVQWHTYPVSAM